MKSSRIFWATLFIAIGVLGLLHNLHWLTLSWHIWHITWPAILILIGAVVLLRNHPLRWIATAAAGLLAAILIFTFFVRAYDTVEDIGESVHKVGTSHVADAISQSMTEPWDASQTRARLRFESGAGSFHIADTTLHMLAVDATTSLGKYLLTRADSAGMPTYVVKMEDGHITVDDGDFENRVGIRLNPAPLWDLDFEIGAATSEFDLRPWRVRNIDVDAGASSLTFTLGTRERETTMHVEAGAASITIRVPRTAACEVRMDSELTHRDLEGFTRTSDNTWRAAGEGKSPQSIRIALDTGVASVSIQRY